MKKTLQIIDERQLDGKHFRIFGDFENPLFFAKDVAEWIEHSNVRMLLKGVDDNEKVKFTYPVNNPYGGYQEEEQWFLTEEGLYDVLFESRKPVAKSFKKKVKEILKEIRINKGYIATNEFESDEEIMAKALVVANRTIKKRDQLIAEQQPMVDKYNSFLNSEGTISIEKFAKTAKFKSKGNKVVGRNQMFKILRNLKILQSKSVLPYQKYIDSGYFLVTLVPKNGSTFTVTTITPTGFDWLCDRIRQAQQNGEI